VCAVAVPQLVRGRETFLEVRAREAGAKRLERAPRGRGRRWRRRRAGGALGAIVVGVAVVFDVRDERDGVEASAPDAAGDEGVRDAGRVGDAEVEVDAGEALVGGAVLVGIGACASHAKLRGGGAVGVVTLDGESDRVTAHVAMVVSPPMGSHVVALLVAAAGKG